MKVFIGCILSLMIIKSVAAQQDRSDSLKQALGIAQEDTGKVNLLFNLSFIYLFKFPDSSAAFAREGLELSQKIDDKKGAANCMNMLCLSLTN